MMSAIKYVFFFLLVVAMISTIAEAACKDEFGDHCKVFAPFCSDGRYKDIASKCAASCGHC